MNPVVGGTMLPPVSLQQPVAVAYVKSPAEGAALGGAVSRFDAAMAVGPTEHVAASSGMSGVSSVSMAQAVPPSAPPQAADEAAAVDPSQATHPAASVGDRILSSLRSVSDGAAHTWNSLGQLAHASGDMNIQQMLSFQMGAMQASVQFDYVGKIISRATQNLDQLVKTQ